MLVIARKPGQGFSIDEDIEVFVLEVQDRVVKIGINAPRSKQILRNELGPRTEAREPRGEDPGR